MTKENTPIPQKIWAIIVGFGVIAGILGSMAEFFNFIDVFPSDKSYQLTVFVRDIEGNVVLEHEGELSTTIGNRALRETIGEDGRTNFGDILPEYYSDTITIGIKAKGWKLANENKEFIFEGKPITIMVKKDESLATIKGKVKSRDGQTFIADAKIHVNSDTVITTDQNGNFQIVLPESMSVESEQESYKLSIEKEGYKTKTVEYKANSSNFETRLNTIK